MVTSANKIPGESLKGEIFMFLFGRKVTTAA